MYRIVLFVGIPGAGKTTFYETHMADRWKLVSKDRISGVKREAKQQAMIEEALRNGDSVVVDNNNVTKEDRLSTLRLAQTHRVDIAAVWFNTPLDVCKQRNQQRSRVVPEWVLDWRGRILQPPEMSEGFHRIFTVHAQAEGIEFDRELLE